MTREEAIEVVKNMNEEVSAALFTVVGKTFVTGKKQSTPKAIYSVLNKDEKKAFKFFIDEALNAL